MRTHRRRQPLDHVMIAAGIEDSASVASVVALLPPTAFGQVFIEAPADQALPELLTPPRLTVHRLERAEPGVRLSQAIDAWMAEWDPAEPDADREVTIWVGSCATAHAGAPWQALGAAVEPL